MIPPAIKAHGTTGDKQQLATGATRGYLTQIYYTFWEKHLHFPIQGYHAQQPNLVFNDLKPYSVSRYVIVYMGSAHYTYSTCTMYMYMDTNAEGTLHKQIATKQYVCLVAAYKM